MLQVIVAAGADVTVRARGTFFHPADQQNSCPPEDSNYEVGKREDEDDDSDDGGESPLGTETQDNGDLYNSG